MKEIQGKSTLVWVSARFELARIRVIQSQLYYVEQTKLLTRFRKDFTSSVWNFCCWGLDIPSGNISLTAGRKERRLLSASQKGAEKKGPKWLQIKLISTLLTLKITSYFNIIIVVLKEQKRSFYYGP